MSGDLTAGGARQRGSTAVLPSLDPVLVADHAIADELFRSSRAGLAMLALELRVALHEAATAEAAGTTELPVDPLVATEARLLARTSLDDHLVRRRAELAHEVERARVAAARGLSAAQAEATAVVDEARQELLLVLLDGVDQCPPRGPGLRFDTDPMPPGALLEPPAGPVGEPAPEIVAPPAPSDVGVTGIAPVPAGFTIEREAPAQPAPAIVVAAPLPADDSASFWARYLYADVVLPLVAVLIVAVVLLAWVG